MYKELILLVIPTGVSLWGVCAVDDHRNSILPEIPVSATLDASLGEPPTALMLPADDCDLVDTKGWQPPMPCQHRVLGMAATNVNGHLEIEVAYLDADQQVVKLAAAGTPAEVRLQVEAWPEDLQQQVFRTVL